MPNLEGVDPIFQDVAFIVPGWESFLAWCTFVGVYSWKGSYPWRFQCCWWNNFVILVVEEVNYQRRISSLLWFAWFLRRVSRGNTLYFCCQLLHGGLAALVFEFPDCFLVDSVLDSPWVILTVTGGVESLFHVSSYSFVDIRRLINHTICIRVTDFGPASIPRFDVTVNEDIHDGFPALRDSEPQGDWLVLFQVSHVHVNGHYIIIYPSTWGS